MADISVSEFKLPLSKTLLDNVVDKDNVVDTGCSIQLVEVLPLKELICVERFQEALSGKGFEQYTIQKGDTLSRLASKHGTTWQYLQRVNCIPDADQIKECDTLFLPDKPLGSE